MIDLHSHVLPGIDDGPATLEGTIELARAAAAQGTRTMVATPHVTWDHPANTATRIRALAREVNGALREAGVDLDVLPGGEVAMSRVADLDDAELVGLRLGGGPWLLIECPFSPAAAGFDAILHAIGARGHRIVLAHPERSPAFLRRPERLEDFVHAGMLTQITASSLTGAFGKEVRRAALKMLELELVHVVASDAHDDVRRPPALREPLRGAGLDRALARWLTRDVPRAVLDGTPIPARPKPAEPAPGLFGRLRAASRRR